MAPPSGSTRLSRHTPLLRAGALAFAACADPRGSSIQGDDAAEASTTLGGSGDASGEGGESFDVGGGGGGGGCEEGQGGGGNGGAKEFSYIWIANSAQATVSKIDTREGVEVARYRTSAQASANPSRTAVNLYGDVAILNRQVPGVVKIAARLGDCHGTSTSTGPDDVKAFGEDDCVLWVQSLPASGAYEDGPRPIGWEGAEGGYCDQNPRLWVGWGDGATSAGWFRRLDGATGEMLDEVQVPGWQYSVAPIGPYGGAVDAQGDFWAVGIGGPLVRIDGETLQVEFHPRPANSWFYGIALDVAGKPWMGDLSGVSWRYDPDTGQFLKHPQAGARGRGVAIDRSNRAFMPVHANPDPIAGQCSLAELSAITGQVQANVSLPGCVEPVGVAIDADGFVWVVDKGANAAFKVDPELRQVVLTVGGLDQPYTYSDMTGAGLDLVTNPPVG